MPNIIITGGGATSASHADYINNAKGEKRKDEKIIFNSSESQMSQKIARNHLAEKSSEKNQFIKLIFSPDKGVFDKLGETQEKRLAAMEEVVRKGLDNLFKELGVKDVKWIAGTHLNTGNPHTHIVFNTKAVAIETGAPKDVPKIPRSWFWRENNSNSTIARLFEGPIADHSIATPPESVRTKKTCGGGFLTCARN